MLCNVQILNVSKTRTTTTSSHASRLPREAEFSQDKSPEYFLHNNFHNIESTQACSLTLKLHSPSVPERNLLGLTEYAYSKKLNSMKPKLNISRHFRDTKEGFVVAWGTDVHQNTEFQLELKLSSATDCSSASEKRFERAPVNCHSLTLLLFTVKIHWCPSFHRTIPADTYLADVEKGINSIGKLYLLWSILPSKQQFQQEWVALGNRKISLPTCSLKSDHTKFSIADQFLPKRDIPLIPYFILNYLFKSTTN